MFVNYKSTRSSTLNPDFMNKYGLSIDNTDCLQLYQSVYHYLNFVNHFYVIITILL